LFIINRITGVTKTRNVPTLGDVTFLLRMGLLLPATTGVFSPSDNSLCRYNILRSTQTNTV